MGWKHRLATGVFSRHFVQALKREARVQAARLRCLTPSNRGRLRALRHARGLSLNLGAGFHLRDGWTPIDLMVDPPGGVRWDVRWGLPFDAGSVTRIHWSVHGMTPGPPSVTADRECTHVRARAWARSLQESPSRVRVRNSPSPGRSHA